GESNRMMAKQLEAPQREQRHKIADVQRIGGRIKAAIQNDGGGQALLEGVGVSAIGDQVAPFKFVQDGHGRAVSQNFEPLEIAPFTGGARWRSRTGGQISI